MLSPCFFALKSIHRTPNLRNPRHTEIFCHPLTTNLKMSSQNSLGKPSSAIKKQRAIFAQDTIKILIPKILSSNQKARHGVESTRRIWRQYGDARPEASPTRKGPKEKSDSNQNLMSKYLTTTSTASKSTSTPASSSASNTTSQPSPSTTSALNRRVRITVQKSDTLDAAHEIYKSLPANQKGVSRVGVLNMASYYSPGGGVMSGAIAQEESLCLRSTLFHALDKREAKDPKQLRFYPIARDGGLLTRDILVFRDSNSKDLKKEDRFYVDVISVAAIKEPDRIVKNGREFYKYDEDEEEMIAKIRLIIKTARSHDIKYLILGALGCGAYYNPPKQVAELFKKVLLGEGRREDDTKGIVEIVFAIFDDGENLRVFKQAFDGTGKASSGVSVGSTSLAGDGIRLGDGTRVKTDIENRRVDLVEQQSEKQIMTMDNEAGKQDVIMERDVDGGGVPFERVQACQKNDQVSNSKSEEQIRQPKEDKMEVDS